MSYANGDQYEGDFDMGKREGTGYYTWKKGGRYHGTFKADKRDGRGRYILKKRLEKGEWHNDILIGE